MITAEINEHGDHTVWTGFRTPAVYLDTWAISTFAKDVVMGEQFTKLLKHHNGTLLISHANLVELGRLSQEDLSLIQCFFNHVGTNWCPVDSDAVRVIKREVAGSKQPPFLDEDLIMNYYPYIANQDLTLTKAMEMLAGNKEQYDAIHAKADNLAAEMTRVRVDFQRKTPGFNTNAYLTRDYDAHRPTRYVYDGLMREVLESDMKFETNDVFDICHVSVSLAYGNFVLMDGRWAHIAKARLKKLPWNEKWIFTKRSLNDFLKVFGDLKVLPPPLSGIL